ncbi:MAG: rRNA maturation RNase YbeY [Saprospiraceae bacterium]
MEPADPIEPAIQFFAEDLDFEWDQQEALSDWISDAIVQEGKSLGFVNFILCTDAYLLEMNLRYLEHDTLTDVITFPYHTDPIEGDVFISLDRIYDNAAKFDVTVLHELNRVMIHGVLHLCGYDDHDVEAKAHMSLLEDRYLSKWKSGEYLPAQ